MNTFAVNLILALAWATFFGSFTIITMVSGFLLGTFVLWLLHPLIGGSPAYYGRVYYWVKLVILFHYELVVSSLEVMIDILTPKHRSRPAIIEVPLDVKTDAGILLVTNLISLTPGTLSLDVSEDRKTLTIHAMFADDPDEVCRVLKEGMEAWVIDAVEGER